MKIFFFIAFYIVLLAEFKSSDGFTVDETFTPENSAQVIIAFASEVLSATPNREQFYRISRKIVEDICEAMVDGNTNVADYCEIYLRQTYGFTVDETYKSSFLF